MADSSFIAAHTYDHALGELILRLHSGDHLRVPDVSREHYAAFSGHHSLGSYFNTHFKHKAKPHKPTREKV